jgi:hypothetical protein
MILLIIRLTPTDNKMKPVWNSHLSEPKEKTGAIFFYITVKAAKYRLNDEFS